jgi:hypothetical protein
MDTDIQPRILVSPRVYLVRMGVFLIIVAFLAAILFPQMRTAFMTNPGLNGLIVAVLFLGIIYAALQVRRLYPEVNWVNNFRIGDPGIELIHTPVLLAPMAAMLRDRRGRMVLSTLSMRSLLDSIGVRLDEARDISRYLIGLLVFLGLLGTFWGLIDTVTSVGQTIRSLDVGTTESGLIFEDLKAGLERPLQGMGTAFSSSLFGLAGSLVLGFLDLQAAQAQNRFYNDLEDWLSSVTDIESGSTGEGAAAAGGEYGVPNYLRLDLRDMSESLSQINASLQRSSGRTGGSEETEEAIGQLADAVHELVRQMREEQKVVREWAQSQADQQSDIRDVLERLSEKPLARRTK